MTVEDRPEELTRAMRRAERRDATPWLGAAILITLGVVFLVQNLGIARVNNWWAVFILIPAVGSFATAWRTYQANGSWSAATGSLIGGVLFSAVAIFFLFEIDFGASWNVIWPLGMVAGGIALLLQAIRLRS
jgi:hypothetical protein